MRKRTLTNKKLLPIIEKNIFNAISEIMKSKRFIDVPMEMEAGEKDTGIQLNYFEKAVITCLGEVTARMNDIAEVFESDRKNILEKIQRRIRDEYNMLDIIHDTLNHLLSTALIMRTGMWEENLDIRKGWKVVVIPGEDVGKLPSPQARPLVYSGKEIHSSAELFMYVSVSMNSCYRRGGNCKVCPDFAICLKTNTSALMM